MRPSFSFPTMALTRSKPSARRKRDDCILELLTELRLVQRIDVGQGVARYERHRPDGDHHHHLVCDCCGLVAPFEDPALEQAIERVSRSLSVARPKLKRSPPMVDAVTRLEKLSKSGGFSQVDLIKLQLEAAGAEKDQAVAQRTLEQVRLERQQMQNEHARKRAEETAEVEKLKMKLEGLKSDLENSQQSLLTIRAPYDAVVISLSQRNAGSVVQSGQELCQLARTESKPLARLLLNESGLAKIAMGQPVRFFFEAFPYQRYGALSGKLDWVSPSAVSSTGGQHFVALASFEDTANRQRLTLRVGMKGEARIRVGRRTLIEYAFEPIKQLKEGIRN